MADTALAGEIRRRKIADDLLSSDDDPDPDPDDSATSDQENQETDQTDASEDKSDESAKAAPVSVAPERTPKGLNYYLGPAINAPTSAQPPAEASKPAPATEKPAAASSPVIDTEEFAGDPLLTKAQEPPGAIELPAVTVTEHLPPSVALASRELRPPPEDYGVAPRAELVQLPPPRTGPVSMASRDIGLPAPRAELVPPPTPSVAAASRELDLAPSAEAVEVRKGVALPPVVRRAELFDPDPDRAAFEAAGMAYPGEPETVSGIAPRAQELAEPPTVARAIPADAAPPIRPAVGEQAPRAVPPDAAEPVGRAQSAQDELPPMNAPNGQSPVALIIHHTSGRGSAANVVDGWRTERPGVGAQYILDRDGTIHETQKEFGYGGHGHFLHSVIPGVSNQTAVGIEVIAKDDADMTPAQLASLQRFAGPGGPYANVPVYGHSQVSPGDRDNEGVRGVAAINEARAAGGQAPGEVVARAQPSTKLGSGFYQGEDQKQFLTGRITTFATPEDIASGEDNGRGAGRVGGLDTTQVAGVAVPEWVLQSQLGNNPAAWRKARVDVIDPKTGKRFRVPIVDLGPRGDRENAGVIADMTPALAKLIGGDGNYSIRLVANAGVDVHRNPQLFYDEQDAIKSGFDSSTLDKGVIKTGGAANYVLGPPLEPAAQESLMTHDAQNQSAQRQTLAALGENQTFKGFIDQLSKPVEGVNDALRNSYLDEVKREATAYAQEYYGEKDPARAYQRITTDADAGTFAGDVMHKIVPQMNQAVTVFNQSAAQIDQNRLDQLAKALHPEATIEGRQQFINSILAIPDEPTRAATINQLIGSLPPDSPALAALNPLDIADSAKRLADPEYQRRQKAEIARQVAQNLHDLRTDPRLSNTAAWWSDQLSSLPKNVVEAMSGPIGGNLMLSEIQQSTYEGLKKEHPDWDEDKLRTTAGVSTMAQFIPMEILQRATAGAFGGAVKGITNPVGRIAANAAAHLGIGGTTGAAMQAAANVAEGRPVAENLGPAAIGGALMAAPGAVIGAARRAPVAQDVKTSPDLVERAQTPPVPEREVVPPPSEGKPAPQQASGDVIGFSTAKGSTYVLHDDGTTTRNKAPRPEHPGDEGLKERSTKTVYLTQQEANALGTPSDTHWRVIDHGDGTLSIATEDADGKWGISPSQRNIKVSDIPSAGAIPLELWKEGTTQGVRSFGEAHFGNPITEIRRATTTPLPAEHQPELQRALNGEVVVPGTPPEVAPVSEAEPWISKIANKHTAQRMAAGELGPVAPGEGASTEALLARGLSMGPEEVAQHVSNVMNNVGGDPVAQASAIRAEEARLSQRSNSASRASEADPSNQEARIAADNAFKDLTDFHNGPVAKLKNDWHKTGKGLQGEMPVDLSTFNGLREAFLKENGKSPDAKLEPAMRDMAKKVSDAAVADKNAMLALSNEIKKQSAMRKLPSADEVRNRIREQIGIGPCPT